MPSWKSPRNADDLSIETSDLSSEMPISFGDLPGKLGQLRLLGSTLHGVLEKGDSMEISSTAQNTNKTTVR
jgi:hypothetical protein